MDKAKQNINTFVPLKRVQISPMGYDSTTNKEYAPEPVQTWGQFYAIHTQGHSSLYTEEFKQLIENIADRFKAGEWNDYNFDDYEFKEEVFRADERTRLKALALDAFLALASDEEIEHFEKVSQTVTAQKLGHITYHHTRRERADNGTKN